MVLEQLRPSEPSPIAVAGITQSPDTPTVAVGNTVQLAIVVSPVDATDKSVTYTSSDDLVATVDGNGLVTGVAEGTADITVTTNDGSFTDISTVTVTL